MMFRKHKAAPVVVVHEKPADDHAPPAPTAAKHRHEVFVVYSAEGRRSTTEHVLPSGEVQAAIDLLRSAARDWLRTVD